MTIYDIKRLTAKTNPYFFSRDTMKFFNQTLKDYRVYKHEQNNVKGFFIVASMKDHSGKNMGFTRRFFNPETNELDKYEEISEWTT